MVALTEEFFLPGAGERRLVFISDLHLATDDGKRDFFAQDELADLLDDLIDSPDPTDLIITGDFFDLLQLTDETPGHDRVAAFRCVFECPEYATMRSPAHVHGRAAPSHDLPRRQPRFRVGLE